MPKQKIELSNEQKNIAKRFLLCNRPTCIKDDGQTAVATRLCAFCYKVGYCCTQCMNKDISRHVENECQKNLNSAPPTQASSSEKPLNDTKLQTKKPPGKNGILRIDTVNVNDYLSGSESSGTEEEPQPNPRKLLSRSTSSTRNRTKK